MKFGLIRGRHDIPDVDGYIFDGDVSPVDTGSYQCEKKYKKFKIKKAKIAFF